MPRIIDPSRQRLRASPNFSLALTLDGRAYVAKDTEPYIQYWVSESERWLWAAFSGRGGATASQGIETCIRQSGKDSSSERRRLQRALAGMQAVGVVVAADEDTSRYDRRILQHYLTHRPFPSELTAEMVKQARMDKQTRVLDLAGGPGDLALQLAAHAGEVSLLELSRSFLAAARSRAKQQGLVLRTLHESCNRLVFHDDSYDVITVSQALHWLDDVLVCRGVCRVLAPNGHFFVIHSAFEVDPDHPLAFMLGHDSVLGRKIPAPFATEVQALHERTTALLQALDSRQVERADVHEVAVDSTERSRAALRPAGLALYEQRRPLDEGFVRALLTPQHLAAAGLEEAPFWAEVQARCAAASPRQLLGRHHWAVLHYARSHRTHAVKAASAVKVKKLGFSLG